MSSIAEDLARSREYGRQCNLALRFLVAAVVAVLIVAIANGTWPPRETSPTSHAGKPG
jgi:hypothetical protein